MMDPKELLEQIRAYRPPTKLHPIAGKTYDLYDAGGFKLSEAALQEIRADLAAFNGDLKGLTDALCGLSAFIMYAMESLNDPVAAEQVAKLIQETKPQYAEIGSSLSGVLQDLAQKATGVLDRFSGRDLKAKKRAPTFGSAPPEGAIPASAMMKPRAEPPLHVVRKPPAQPGAKPPPGKKR